FARPKAITTRRARSLLAASTFARDPAATARRGMAGGRLGPGPPRPPPAPRRGPPAPALTVQRLPVVERRSGSPLRVAARGCRQASADLGHRCWLPCGTWPGGAARRLDRGTVDRRAAVHPHSRGSSRAGGLGDRAADGLVNPQLGAAPDALEVAVGGGTAFRPLGRKAR